MAVDARPSLLDGLKARREEILAGLIKDIPVPGLPGVVLRVRPVEHAIIGRQRAKVRKAKTPEAEANLDLAASAAVIAAALAGDGTGVIFGAGGDEEELHSLKDVADVLLPDAEKVSGADTIQALFLRDGDVLRVGEKVMKHSGYADDEADDSLQGE